MRGMIPNSVVTERANRAQRMLRRIVGASTDVIYVYHALWDRIGFLGRQVHEVLGRAALPSRRLKLPEFERLVHPADRPGLRRHLASFERAADGEVLSHQLRVKGADGHYRWLRGRGTVLARTADGRVSKVVVANQDLTDVIETKQELRDLSGRIYSLREEERQRIAQELHDSTAQHLVAATLNLMTLRAKAAVSYPGVNNLLESVETALEEATRELRAFTYLLHPLALENDGLEQTLHTYLDGFARRTRLDAQASVAGDVESLPFALQCALLRIIQEALANVHRHAAASHVSISLRTTADAVELIVADDGCGMQGRTEEGACNGMGIPGMRARLREFDGRLEIRAGPHRGTTIVARIPLAAVRRRPALPRLAIEGTPHRLE
jgi:two-component system, NarL family, sensor kinase